MGNRNSGSVKCYGEVGKCGKGELPIIFCNPWGIKCLIDTGSDSSIITFRGLRKIVKEPQIGNCNCLIRTLTGSQKLIGKSQINLNGLIGVDVLKEVHIVKTCGPKYDFILGADILELAGGRIRYCKGSWKIKLRDRKYKTEDSLSIDDKCNVMSVTISNTGGRVGKIKELVEHFRDCFYNEGEALSTTGRVRHRIDLTTEKPIFVKPRRYPHKVKEIIKEHIEDMLQQGIIRKSRSPYCSPLWVVPKKTGTDGVEKFRVVVDYRELNRFTKAEKYPLPRLEDMLDRMLGATVFSVVDLKSGYHQILMAEEDVPKTAFSFERGHFEFLRMPFGLKNAPSTFQRLMDEFLEELDENCTQIYMDDIIVFSSNWKEHEVHLKQLLTRVRKFGLKVSPDKSKFGEPEVKFMGHLVTSKGVKPNPERVRAIRVMSVPKNVKEVRMFLGMVGYYRRFLDKFADMTEPLTALLKKGNKFRATERVVESVENCKKALCTAPILKFPNFGRPFVVTTDASQEALGAVLSQIDEEGDRPIAFASRKLSPAERRYSAIERELLGVVWAIEYFRPYLFGTQFQVKTDHMPLVWIEKLKETSSRIARWKERLAAYSFTIHHTKGVDNVVADCLSRNIGVTETLQDKRIMLKCKGTINDKANQIIWVVLDRPGPINVEFKRYGHTKIIRITAPSLVQDIDIKTILNQILRPGKLYYWHTKNNVARNKIGKLFEEREIATESEFIWCERMVETVEDEDRQAEIVQNYHDGLTNHRGINETTEQLKRTYYWLKMKETVRQAIINCTVCNKGKYDRHPPRAPQLVTATVDGPFKKIFIDVFHYQTRKYLTAIDAFSRLLFVHKLCNKKASAIKEGLLNYFAVYGVPKEISMDKGREFCNVTIKQLLQEFNVNTHWGTTGHHRSQGTIERVHNTIIEHLQLLKIGMNLGVDDAMNRAVIAYNNTIHSCTQYAPVELALAVDRDAIDRQREVTDKMKREKNARIKKWNCKNAEDIQRLVKLGAVVYKRNFYKRRKDDNRYIGPYIIIEILSRNKVKIERYNAPRGRKEIIHVDDLKFPAKRGRQKHEHSRETE